MENREEEYYLLGSVLKSWVLIWKKKYVIKNEKGKFIKMDVYAKYC